MEGIKTLYLGVFFFVRLWYILSMGYASGRLISQTPFNSTTYYQILKILRRLLLYVILILAVLWAVLPLFE